ncbi:hypothetical protein EYF80_014165 [Liparis tanakae]|uniref:Uncharacterized protein n=1 Tax=Liparis tanakae TaxID=230148 RepID=A0A4Z2IDJ0_9TELE|nr:hypothetical protein EYF80_014165 [Liparis tanakae]
MRCCEDIYMSASRLAGRETMAEDQLWTGQAAGPLAELVCKSKALSHRQNGLDDEHVGPFLQLFIEDATLSLPQYTIHSAW